MIDAVTLYFASIYENIDDLIYTVFLFVVIVLICNVFREIFLFSGLLPQGQMQLQRTLVAEGIGTVEAAVMCFEINFIIYEAFGVLAYTVILFCTMIWQTKRADRYQFDGNPLVVLTKHIEGAPAAPGAINLYTRFEFVVMMICAEGIGAFIAYQFLMNIAWKNADSWSQWKDYNYHLHKYNTADEWQASIAGNAMLAGLIEGGFSLAQYFWPIYIRFKGFDGNVGSVITDSGRAIFSGIGALFSGGYFNPILASALEINTHGYDIDTKICVYWIAPIVGTLLGILLRNIF